MTTIGHCQKMNDKRKRQTTSTSSASDTSQISMKRIKNLLPMSDSDEERDLLEEIDTLLSPTATPIMSTPKSLMADPAKSLGSQGNAEVGQETSAKYAAADGDVMVMGDSPFDAGVKKLESLEAVIDRLLSTRLNEVKCNIVREIKGVVTDQLEELNGRVFELEIKNAALEERVKRLETAAATNNSKVASEAKVRAIENDQYARRSNMIIIGHKETQDENPIKSVVKLLKDKLNIEMKEKNIEICHRMGQVTLNKIRPMIVKFRYRDTKWDTMKARRGLKGTGITFIEDLCKEMQELQKEVRAYQNTAACFAWNGKILAKDKQGNIVNIRYGSNWHNILDSAAEAALAAVNAPPDEAPVPP